MESERPKERRKSLVRLARAVSVITFPPLVALPAFLILDASLGGPGSRLLVGVSALTFGVIWPIAVSFVLILRRQPAGIETPRERLVVLGLGAIGYSFGVATLVAVGSPILVTLLMFCYATNTLVLLAINLYWRASAHAMGVAGPTIALVFGVGVPGALLSLLLPFVGWSRIQLKAHTLSQVVVGAALGYVLTGTQIALGLRWLR